jgi:hypothetical protein
MMSELFLPGVPADLVRLSLDRAGGKELASGKFASLVLAPHWRRMGLDGSSRDQACFRLSRDLDDIKWPAASVEIERQMRFSMAGRSSPLA